MDQTIAMAGDTRTRGFWRTDDAWAITAALLIVLLGLILFLAGSPIPAWIAVLPPKWNQFAALLAHFETAWPRYLAQGVLWLVIATLCLGRLGFEARRLIPSFLLVYILSVALIALGQWSRAITYNLEPPLLALLLGLLLGNTVLAGSEWHATFRVEFYIKLGVVLLGATLPLSLLVWAGPVALAQASIVSIVTFAVIALTARALGLDSRFAAVLGAGGAICGVSAAIAISAAVGARRSEAGAVISIVILWAIVMIFALPFAAQALHLPAAVGGAWIGTSEFADAAGFAAAQSYDGMAPPNLALTNAALTTAGAHAATGAAGAAVTGPAVAAFTLLKVVGRDIWIGIWAVILSVAFALSEDKRLAGTGIRNGTRLSEIWTRFPKFVLGFLAASILLTLLAGHIGHHAFAKVATPALVTPIKNLRTEAFAFGFLAIGLTTRFSDLAAIGRRPFIAFSAGAVVNTALGLFLSAVVFGAYWTAFGR